jgi:hypothetical protein
VIEKDRGSPAARSSGVISALDCNGRSDRKSSHGARRDLDGADAIRSRCRRNSSYAAIT